MFQPLEDAAASFTAARANYLAAAGAGDAESAVAALADAFNHANAILVFLGLVAPYECGQCPACRANAAVAASADDAYRQAAEQSAALSGTDEDTARRLLSTVFDTTTTPEESA